MGSVLRLIVAVTGLLAASGVFAQDLTNAQRDAAITFVLNNTRHTLLHEIGHLFVDQFDLPVLGREEDAVDNYATLIMLMEGKPSSIEGLVDTVDGWVYSVKRTPGRGFVNSDFYAAHSLDIQRSFAIACLMVGKDRATHTRFATRAGLPDYRQESCEEDFRLARHGWDSVLAPHVRNGAPGAGASVTYEPHERAYGDIATMLQQHRVLEDAADWVVKNYVLPRPVKFTAEVCGEVNAFYVPGASEVILCYEWADFFYDLYVNDIMPVREHFAMMRELKLEKLANRSGS